MEKRVILAVVLMIAVMLLTNLLFPPAPPPQQEAGAGDTAAVQQAADTAVGPQAGPADTSAAAGEREAGGGLQAGPTPDTARQQEEGEGLFGERGEEVPGDTVAVSTPLTTLRFSTRGATLVGARLHRYASYARGSGEDARVELVRPGDRLLGWSVTDGQDTLDLAGRIFEASDTRIRVTEETGPRSVTFRYPVPENPDLVFRVTYRFHPDSYRVGVEGAFEGLGGRGYTILTSLGRGLNSNEANPDEDYGQLGYAVNRGGGEIENQKLDDIESGQRHTAQGGPFRWVAVKNKYFLAAYLAPEESSGFGGLIAEGVEEEHAAELTTSLPVPAGEPGFSFTAYFGPQEFDRLSALGHDLKNVNPIGWDWLRFIIRPLANLFTAILTWMHSVLGLAYGWVLILFGVLMRVVLFPLYQKSMRAQMAQMQLQPVMKELQDKYSDNPEKLQQEMMRLYREHNINPLAGCLPMLLPYPVLITLFFVFQSTIEFRGVSFWWLPDLSLKDPYYIIPVLMGVSMYVLQLVGQRGMKQNTQMKIFRYGMPVFLTVLFAQFPAGLNLYYATSNLASLPQQWFLSKERQKAKKKGKLSVD